MLLILCAPLPGRLQTIAQGSPAAFGTCHSARPTAQWRSVCQAPGPARHKTSCHQSPDSGQTSIGPYTDRPECCADSRRQNCQVRAVMCSPQRMPMDTFAHGTGGTAERLTWVPEPLLPLPLLPAMEGLLERAGARRSSVAESWAIIPQLSECSTM